MGQLSIDEATLVEGTLAALLPQWLGGPLHIPPSVVPRKTMTHPSLSQVLAWSLVLTMAAVGCSSGNGTDDKVDCLTSLRLNLEVADGTVIDLVEYTITGDGMMPMGGVIDTSAPGATASVEQFGIPAGTGYVVTMVATSVDGTLMCGGSATFDVEAGVSTDVMVVLHCKGAEQFGGVRVNGKLNICAELDKVVVAPLQTASGYALEVGSLGSDEEGDEVQYRWSATGGAFDDPSAAETIFNCGEAAEEELTIEVSDDDFTYCVDSWTVPVNCVDDGGAGGSGGDGGGGAGGTTGGGGTAGSGGTTGSGGTVGGGGAGGNAGSGGATGSGGTVGGGGNGGDTGTGGTGGSGTGGTAGSGGSSGSGGNIPPECVLSVSVG